MMGAMAEGRLALGRRLGSGATGVVYEAHDRGRDRRVAVKAIPGAGAAAQARRVLARLRDLHHPNVVELIDVVVDGDTSYVVMELIEGSDLLSYCRAGRAGGAGAGAPCDLDRLRTALAQLASGVAALHACGVVHRDVKPSNVRVTPAGRVVLLDLGLAQVDGGGAAVLGTPEYAAPEQLLGGEVGPWSDWYAIGAVLFQALSGRVPFDGTRREALEQKALGPPPVDALAQAPPELAALCHDLLAATADERPDAATVLDRLGVPAPRAALTARRRMRTSEPPPALGRILTDLERPELRAARVAGGAAWSAVEAALADAAVAHPDLIALRLLARADSPLATSPLDDLGNDLAQAWRALPAAEQRAIAPVDAGRLRDVLPELALVDCVAEAAAPPPATRVARLSGALAALRHTVDALARRHPVVIAIADADRADPDLATVLADLLRPPDPPPVRVIATGDAARVDARLASLTPGAAAIEVEAAVPAPPLAAEVAAVLAVAGEPLTADDLAAVLERPIAALAPGLRDAARDGAVATVGTRGRTGYQLAPADAAAARAALAPARAADLARAIVTRLELPAAAARLWLGAGDRPRAAAAAERAARDAMDRLRFHGGARLCRLAIELGTPEVAERLATVEIDALEGAGRLSEAAQRLIARSAGVEGAERIKLRLRAARLLVVSGHLDDGVAAMRALLAGIGAPLADSPRRAALRFVTGRLRLRLTGARPHRRTRTASDESLAAVDAMIAINPVLSLVQNVEGAALHVTAVRAALRTGDPSRITHALAIDVVQLASIGAADRAAATLRRAEAMAPNDVVTGVRLDLARASYAYLATSDWRRAFAFFDRIRDVHLRHPIDDWYLNIAETYTAFCLYLLGDLSELSRRISAYLRGAERRGDIYSQTIYGSRLALSLLASDDPAAADAALRTGHIRSHLGSYNLPSFYALLGRCEVALYRGIDAAEPYAADRPAIARSRIRRVGTIHVYDDDLGGRIALATARRDAAARPRALAAAQAAAHGLRGVRLPMARPFANAIAGCAAAIARDPSALPLLRTAAQGFAGLSMALHAHAAWYRFGSVQGGAEGDEVVHAAHVALRALGVANPERLAACLMPA